MWGPAWYYKGHNQAAHKTIPWGEGMKFRRKAATSSNAIYQLIRQGKYGDAVRKFFNK